MTSLILQHPPVAVPRSLRRRMLRTACASAVAVLGWSVMSSHASAAPVSPVRAPVVETGFAGLRMGSQGAAVRSLQQALVAAGINVRGGVDGVFGSATRQAVVDFQASRGLPVTGEVDQATSSALAAAGPGSGSERAVAASSSDYVGLRQGARGPAVKTVQQRLAAKGVWLAGGADGVYGAATTRAVKQFQAWNGLTQTGGITIRTAAALGLGSGSGSGPGGGSTAPPTPAASPYLGLRVGARGSAVRDVQRALITAGVTVRGGADGAFGNVTKTALTSYQTAVGVAADGTVNQATIDKLGLGSSRGPVPFAGATPPGPTPPPPPSNNPYVGLRIGSRGTKVAELQRALQGAGLVVRGGADGVFGPATATALKAFQRVNGIPQTGVTTERGVRLLALGSGGGRSVANPTSGGGGVTMERFPVQGRCFFGDTWGASRGGGRRHEGVDIIANEGNLLYAVTDGEITRLYWDQPGALAGNGVRLAQANGTYFTYLHLSGFAPGVQVGTKVQAGDVIGFVGNTGSSATAHLHFEIHPGGGAAVNPYPYVKAIDDCSNTRAQYQSSFT